MIVESTSLVGALLGAGPVILPAGRVREHRMDMAPEMAGLDSRLRDQVRVRRLLLQGCRTIIQISDKAGMSEGTVRRLLKEMMDQGEVSREQLKTRAMHYVMTDRGRSVLRTVEIRRLLGQGGKTLTQLAQASGFPDAEVEEELQTLIANGDVSCKLESVFELTAVGHAAEDQPQ